MTIAPLLSAERGPCRATISTLGRQRVRYGTKPLSGLEAAHWHAIRLAYRLREHSAETGEDWVIAVADETGAAPLVVLPSAVPMLREPATPPEQWAERRPLLLRGVVGP